MLTWAGFIATLLNFAATKLLGRTIDVALDKKSRAAKAFYALYKSLDDVQAITQRVIAILDAAADHKKPVFFARDIIELAPTIDRASNTFIESLDPAMHAIEIFDPKLAYLLSGLYLSKLGYGLSLRLLLLQLGAEFVVEFKAARHLERLRYSAPRRMIAGPDLEALYLSLERRDTPVRGGEVPILFAQMADSVNKEVVSSRDFEKLVELKQQLSLHLATISEAQDTLRAFMSRTFTIDDLLLLQ